MNKLYTAYCYSNSESTKFPKVGMNDIVYLSHKHPTAKDFRECCDAAWKRGYDVVVFFADDTTLKTIEL